MDKTSLAYIKDKAEKGAKLAAKIEYCENALTTIEEKGMGWVQIGTARFNTTACELNIDHQDLIDCYGEIALQVIKDLRDRYQAEFDAL